VPSVLVVDDDFDLRESICEVLSRRGYAVSTAPNGQAALDLLLDGFRPSLIVLDLMMPVMNGQELLASLEQRGDLARIPILICSAKPTARAMLTRYCLPKPFGATELIQAVEAALEPESMRRQKTA
jgi:CheY-like chemotaxis protein